MSVALFLLRCTEVGLSMADLDELTVGMVNDMFVEKSNDSYDWKEIANQDDFDRFYREIVWLKVKKLEESPLN